MQLYRLTICVGEPNEQTVYAYLNSTDVEMICKDINGELNCEYLIALTNGETIDTGIIDHIERAKETIDLADLLMEQQEQM